jgi:uncharacterized C2H2 Zn-finger protein
MKKVNFEILEDKRHINVLKCPECEHVFKVNALSGENLIWDAEMLMDVARCPQCNVEQG